MDFFYKWRKNSRFYKILQIRVQSSTEKGILFKSVLLKKIAKFNEKTMSKIEIRGMEAVVSKRRMSSVSITQRGQAWRLQLKYKPEFTPSL